MEDQAPYVAAVAYPEALAPYAAVLVAEGFEPEDWSPSSQPCLYASWQPLPQLYYFCDLLVVEGEIWVWLVRKQANKPPFRLFHWMQVATPDELRWLLQRNVHLRQARATAADEAETCALLQAILGEPPSLSGHRQHAPQSAADYPDAAAELN